MLPHNQQAMAVQDPHRKPPISLLTKKRRSPAPFLVFLRVGKHWRCSLSACVVFYRHMDCEVVQFEILSEDYSKLAFLQADRLAVYNAHVCVCVFINLSVYMQCTRV